MKKYFRYYLIVLILAGSSSCAWAMENPDLEGWIVKIDATKSQIRVLSANPEGDKLAHDHFVKIKPGLISDFKMNDYVQVKYREDLPYYALMVEKSFPKVGQQAQKAG